MKQTTRPPPPAAAAAAAATGTGTGGGPAPVSLASLYPQVVPDAAAPSVPRVSALAGFSSAARRAQLGAGSGGGGGGSGSQHGGGPQPAIPPTVTYPASALVTGGAAALHPHNAQHIVGSARGSSGASGLSSLSSTPNGGGALFHVPSAATSATYRSSLLSTGGSTLPPANPSAARFTVTPHAALTAGAGSSGASAAAAAAGGVAGAGGAVAAHPGHTQAGWGGGGLAVPGTFAGTPSLLPGSSSSLQHHAALFGGGTAGGSNGGAGAGLAQPAGALTAHSGTGALGSGQGSAAKSLFSVHSSASSGLGNPPVPASFVAVGGVGHALQLQAQQARLELAQQQKVALDVGQPLNALTCSPDRTHLAVGGKEGPSRSHPRGRCIGSGRTLMPSCRSLDPRLLTVVHRVCPSMSFELN